MSTLVLFDFDRTLFNTTKFYDRLLAQLKLNKNIDDNTYERLLPLVKDRGITHPLSVLNDHGVSFAQFSFSAKQLDGCLYDDWKEIDKYSHKMVYTTAAEPQLQQVKLEISGIAENYQYQIVPSNKGELLKQSVTTNGGITFPAYSSNRFDHIVLIDDNAKSLYPLLDIPQIYLVQLMRPDTPYPQNNKGIKVVRSLEELWPLTKQL